MTAPEFPPPPPPGYWISRMMAEDKRACLRAIYEGEDRYIDQFVDTLNWMQEAMGIERQRDPVKRLAAYLKKPRSIAEAMQAIDPMTGVQTDPMGLFSWEMQQAKFPNDYLEDWDDFQKLRARAAAGEFRDKM